MGCPFAARLGRPALLLAGLAAIMAVPAVAQTQAPIVIPPAPTIVASPPGSSGPAPAVPDAGQTTPLIAVPPGLTLTPVPQAPLTPGPSAPGASTPGAATPGAATPGAATPGAAANADNGAAPAAPAVASWDPVTAARLGVLNVIDGSVSEVQIPVGGQASIGDLKVSVLACLRRPPGQVPDAAAFIDVQASDAGAPPPLTAANGPLDAPPEGTADQGDAASGSGSNDSGRPSPEAGAGPAAYRGWMVRSMPAAMVVGDASETFRVIDCS